MEPKKPEFSLEDYASFMAGDHNPKILEALKDPSSEASKHFEEMRTDNLRLNAWLDQMPAREKSDSDGSKDSAFTLDDYEKFMGGDGNPKIIDALEDPNSEASRYFVLMREKNEALDKWLSGAIATDKKIGDSK